MFKEFNSFYQMKEWLLEGEYTFPSIYFIKNNGAVFIDIPIPLEGKELYNRIGNGIRGLITNRFGQMSSVLCSIMNNHFTGILTTPITDSDGDKHKGTNKLFFSQIKGEKDNSTNTTYSFDEFRFFRHYGEICSEGDIKANTIGPDTFANSNITSIIIPEGITHISDRAFYKCRQLEKVILPSTLEYIGEQAFMKCSQLNNVIIPPSVKIIDSGAFMACKSLNNLIISNGVKYIGRKAFHGCNIEKLIIPDSVYIVCAKAFGMCKNLKKVWIGQHCGKRIEETIVDLEYNGSTIQNYYYPITINGVEKKFSLHFHPTVFYGSDVEKFYVDKRNTHMKVGISGELMINRNHEVSDKYMVIKVPVTLTGHYVVDDRATSLIHNLFELNNAPTGITSIDFNNVTRIPKHCLSNNTWVTEVYMPHVHNFNANAFNTAKITKMVIGGKGYDDFLNRIPIQINETEGKENILLLNKDCEITVPDSVKPLYQSHSMWKKYFEFIYNSYIIAEMGSDWRFSPNIINSNPSRYHDILESYSNINKNNSAAYLKLRVKNVPNYSFGIRSYGENNYDYVMVSQLDTAINSGTSCSNTSLVKAHTSGISSTTVYTTVSFTDIPENEHEINVIYRKNSSQSGGTDQGYVQLLKETSGADIEIHLQHFEEVISGETRLFQSTNSGDDYDETFSVMKIHFRNNPDFKILVASMGEETYDYITVGKMDTYYIDDAYYAVNNNDIQMLKDCDWFDTTSVAFNYVSDKFDISSYKELTFPNDGGLHFIEIYYIKDGRNAYMDDRGYVIIPSLPA